MSTHILTLKCPDQPGIVHAVTGVLAQAGANITESAQFGDTDTGLFSMRTEFEIDHLGESIDKGLEALRKRFSATIQVRPTGRRKRALIMVSKEDHCLLDLLYRHRNGELAIDIPLIVSNHPDCRELADRYGIPYRMIPVTGETKEVAESQLVRAIEEERVDFVVLARYMQILSADLCARLPGRIINIHHSFLPGFKGARPYHQAHLRGVKLIGATAHYVTADLDEGPIIVQDVEPVSHAHTVDDLTRVGRDIERMVLSRAVKYHAEDRVILIGSKTVVFS